MASITFTYGEIEIETAASRLGNGKEEITNTLIAQLTEIQTFLTGTTNAMRDFDSQIASKIN